MQHAPRPATAWAALGVSADRTLLFQEFQSLLENGFGQPQLRLFAGQLLEQARGVVVVLQKTFEHPADREFEIKELRWWLTEILFDIRKTGAGGLASGEHSGCVTDSMKSDLILRFKREFQEIWAVGPAH